MMPNFNDAPIDATPDLPSLVLAMQQDLASLQASQIAANQEITYLRSNNDRIVREVCSEFRQLKHKMKSMRNQLEEMEQNQARLLKRIEHSEANNSASASGSSPAPPTDSRTPSPSQSQPRRLELRRQGAFRGGDINNLPWEQLNDVRGFNPDAPRYHWSATSPQTWAHNPHANRKRPRDAVDADSVPFFEQVQPDRHGKVDSEDGELPTKRRKVSSGARIARTTTTPHRRSSLPAPRPPAPQNSTSTRRSASFISDVIAGVSYVFLS